MMGNSSSAGATGAACSLRAASAGVPAGLSDGCVGAPLMPGQKLPIPGDERLMAPKAHGTCERPVQSTLKWGCDASLADRICCYNRHYAEHAGYFLKTTFLADVQSAGETTFYDSVSGRPLFVAPRGRSFAEFEAESRSHGWPSFRDAEVVWDDVRVLPDGECVSVVGTHLGHNLPDRKGNRYCINAVSIAAYPEAKA
jgi:peptide methionine sulfoxide reductase MsrB